MEKHSRKPDEHIGEDWDTDCLTVPITCGSFCEQVAVDSSEKVHSQPSRVFYNQRLSNGGLRANNQRRDKQDRLHNSVKGRPQNNSLSDSSDDKGSGFVSTSPSLQKDNSKDATFSHRKQFGRGRGLLWKEKNAKSDQDSSVRRPAQANKVESGSQNKRPIQISKPQNHQKMNVSSEMQSKATSLPQKSETKSKDHVKSSLKDDTDFPALVPTSNGVPASNFWRDRHAFISSARPTTEDEENDMLRRAMEESLKIEEARQQKNLEEENKLMHLYLQSSDLLSNSTEDIGRPTCSESGEARLNNSLINTAPQEHTDDTCSVAVMATVSSISQTSGDHEVGESCRSGSDSAKFVVTTKNHDLVSTSVTGSTMNTSGFDLAISNNNPVVLSNEYNNHNIYSFSFDSLGDVPEVIYQTVHPESAAHHTSPDVVFQRVSGSHTVTEPSSPSCVCQTSSEMEELTGCSTNLRQYDSTDGVNHPESLPENFQNPSDQYLFYESDSDVVHRSDQLFSFESEAHNGYNSIDDLSCSSSEVGDSSIPSPFPECAPIAAFPMTGSISSPFPMYPYPVPVTHAMISAHALSSVGYVPGYPLFPNRMPAIFPWNCGFPNMMLPNNTPAPGFVPPPGLVSAPVLHPQMAGSPAWFAPGMPPTLPRLLIPSGSFPPFFQMSNAEPLPKNSS